MTGQSIVNFFYNLKCFENGKYFEIALNKMISKMTLLPLPRGSGHDNKFLL